jgi:hypothetical protein
MLSAPPYLLSLGCGTDGYAGGIRRRGQWATHLFSRSPAIFGHLQSRPQCHRDQLSKRYGYLPVASLND